MAAPDRLLYLPTWEIGDKNPPDTSGVFPLPADHEKFPLTEKNTPIKFLTKESAENSPVSLPAPHLQPPLAKNDIIYFLRRRGIGFKEIGSLLHLSKQRIHILSKQRKEQTKTSDASPVGVVYPSPDEITVSPRQLEILQHLGNGLYHKEIAYTLGTSLKTVKNQLHGPNGLYQRLGVNTRNEAIIRGRQVGLLADNEANNSVEATPLVSLTPREKEVLDAFVSSSGRARTTDVATTLTVSVHTVRDHLRHIMLKTELSSRQDILLWYTTRFNSPEMHEKL